MPPKGVQANSGGFKYIGCSLLRLRLTSLVKSSASTFPIGPNASQARFGNLPWMDLLHLIAFGHVGVHEADMQAERRSITVDIEHRLGKGPRRFLRQIVPDAAFDKPVRIFAREFFGIRTGLRMRRTIGITFKSNGGHSDDGSFGKPLFQLVIFRLAFS